MSSRAKSEDSLCPEIPLGSPYLKVVEKSQKRIPRTPRARWTWTCSEYAASLSVSVLLFSGIADHFSFSAQTFLLDCNAERCAEAAPRLCSAQLEGEKGGVMEGRRVQSGAAVDLPRTCSPLGIRLGGCFLEEGRARRRIRRCL